ncbi:hypothetical protein OT109_18595 [Phycisphaeraceae bacterium D3-23]
MSLLVACLLGGSMARAGQHAQVTAQTIIGPGTLPGFGGDVSFQPVGPGINANGDIVFRGYFEGAGITGQNSQAVWVYQDATGPVMMARAGSPAAGYDFFTTYESFHQHSIDDNGQVVITAFIQGPDIEEPSNVSIWAGTPAQLNLIARPDDTIAGTQPPQQYGHIGSRLAHSASGHIAFTHYYPSDILPVPFAEGLIFGTAQALSLYVSSDGQGSAADGPYPGLGDERINRHGDIAFRSGSFEDGYNIYSNASGVLTGVAFQGQQAPGFAAGVVYESNTLTHLLNNGSVGFNAQLSGPGVHANSNGSFWVAHPGEDAELMIREWEFLPSRAGSDRLRTLGRATYNNNGHFAFEGGLHGLDTRADTGIWYGTPGDFELVLQEGDLVPGRAGLDVGILSRPQLNNRDLLVFDAHLRIIGHPESGTSSVWAYRDGVLLPLVVAGDLIDVAAPGQTPDLREVEGVVSGQPSLEDGQNHALNDRDQLALVLRFTDDTHALMRFDLTGVFAPGEPGDLTGDGFVGVEDLDVLLANWGHVTYAGSWRDGDADGDGVVGPGDLDTIIANWSTGTAPGGVIPEPASGLFLLTLMGWIARRRPRRCA